MDGEAESFEGASDGGIGAEESAAGRMGPLEDDAVGFGVGDGASKSLGFLEACGVAAGCSGVLGVGLLVAGRIGDVGS